MKLKDLGLDLSIRCMRKQILLDAMQQIMLRDGLLALITPHAPVARMGPPPFDMAMMAAHSLPAAVV